MKDKYEDPQVKFVDNKDYIWYWDVFGGELLEVKTELEVPLWRRIITWIFLGSKWKRLNEEANLPK